MHRHANCLPWPAPTSGGSTTGSCSAAASARSRSIRSSTRSDPQRDPGLEPGEPALRDRALERARAGDSARGVNVRGQVRRQEGLRRLVERDLGPGHREQVRRGRLEPREDHEVAGDRSAPLLARCPHDDLADAATPLRRHDRGAGDHREPVDRARVGPQVDDRYLGARLAEGASGFVPLRARGEHHRAPAREHAVAVDEQVDRRREHHARQVVVREDRRLLDGAGREHQVSRPDPVEPLAVRGGDQRPAEHAERRRPRDDPGTGSPGLLRQLGDLAAGLGAFLQHDRRGARGRRLGRRREARRAGADHQDVGVQVVDLARS